MINGTNFPPINDRFKLSLITNDEIEYLLQITTEKEYSCANYKIEYEQIINNDQLEVSLIDVKLNGELCLTAFAPAQSIVPIGHTIKKISLINGKQVDEYSVIKCPGGFCLEGKNPLFSFAENIP